MRGTPAGLRGYQPGAVAAKHQPKRMNLYSGEPYWLRVAGEPPPATLTLPSECDVLVVGAGVTGALLADALATKGHEVVVIDRRAPGMGSTAACTALLQF